jgi:hypothetical protein
MVVKKKPMMYLDVTKPNADNNYYLIDSKNKIVGEVPVSKYQKNPEKYLSDEITPMTYTGWRKKQFKKPKTKRCKCK